MYFIGLLFSTDSKSQINVFEKKLDAFRAEKIYLYNNKDILICGRDSLSNNEKLMCVQNGNIKYTLTLIDTATHSINTTDINTVKLITRRNTFIVNEEISSYSMGGFLSFSNRLIEIDSIGNIIWNMQSSDIYKTSNIFEEANGNYIYFGSLDFQDHLGQPVYGEIDTNGTFLEMHKIESNTHIQGFDKVVKSYNGYCALGQTHNGIVSEIVIMNFDSTMHLDFVRSFNLNTETFCSSATQLQDSTVCFYLNTIQNDTTYVVCTKKGAPGATLIRITSPILNAVLAKSNSLLYITYTTKNYLTGVLELDLNYFKIKNTIIKDSINLTYVVDALVSDSTFSCLLSDGRNSSFIKTDKTILAACTNYQSNINFDIYTKNLTNDSLVDNLFGTFSTGNPILFFFSNLNDNWEDSCLNIIDNLLPLSLNEKFIVYPNPIATGTYLTIDVPIFGDLYMYNSLGNLINKYNVIKSHERIELPKNLINGMYLLKLMGKDKVYTSKLILELK